MVSFKQKAGMLLLAVLLGALVLSTSPAAAAVQASITLAPQTRYQTIEGWEATAQAGQDNPAFGNYSSQLFDLAVSDLGLTRLRVEVSTTSSTNAAPNLGAVDKQIDKVALPLRQRLQARGDKLWLNVCYVAFSDSTNLRADPNRYANYVLSTFQHLKTKYGIVPDSMEIELEPDSVGAGQWTGTQVGNALVATGNLLTANGFTPRFIAPSTTSMLHASQYFDQFIQVPGALAYLSEISYHRYADVTLANLQAIASRANQYGKTSAMLERIGADYGALQEDLEYGSNSAWQQYTLAYPTSDNGAQYYWIDTSNPNAPVVNLGYRTKLLRQYFKFIRPGAVRIGSSTTNSSLDPVAFVNPNGSYVVVVEAGAAGSFSIAGLPGGTYGVKYSTPTQYNIDLADVILTAGQSLNSSIPSNGVITIYGKSGGPTGPTPTPTWTSTPGPSPTASRTATRTSTPIAQPTATGTATPVGEGTATPTPPSLGAETLLAPSNNSTVNVKAVTLDWSSLPAATSYNVQLRKTSVTGVLVASARVTLTTFLTPKLSNALYYWRAQACNSGGCGAWSPYWSFRVKPPQPPTLLSPSGGVTANPVVLDWGDAVGATGYRVQVRIDGPGGTVVDSASPVESTYTTRSLRSGHWYYWRVRACSPAGCGGWSASARFQVE